MASATSSSSRLSVVLICISVCLYDMHKSTSCRNSRGCQCVHLCRPCLLQHCCTRVERRARGAHVVYDQDPQSFHTTSISSEHRAAQSENAAHVGLPAIGR